VSASKKSTQGDQSPTVEHAVRHRSRNSLSGDHEWKRGTHSLEGRELRFGNPRDPVNSKEIALLSEGVTAGLIRD